MQTVSNGGDLVAERYRLVDRLGAGGMGTVWRAEDELLERAVALKEVLIPVGLPAAEVTRLRKRYLREARAAARLQHENVIVVHDVISQENTVWIVMELLECPDLAAIVNDDGPLTPAEVARIGLHVLDALVAAHAAGVLHRDVKPANVLITGNGRAVLTDFGVASVAGDASLTATGQLIGSPAYFSPERLTGDQAGPPSDLWSLGCTLYAAVEGASPFLRPEPFEILSAITVEALKPPGKAGRLGPVLYGLLEKDPIQRWDAERTRAALERVAMGMEVPVTPAWGTPRAGRGETTEVRVPSPSQARTAQPRTAGAGPDTGPAPQRATGTAKTPAQGIPAVGPAPRRRRSRVRFTLLLLLLAVLVGIAVAIAYTPVRDSIFGSASGADANPPSDLSEAQRQAFVHPELHYRVKLPAGWLAHCGPASLCRFDTDPDPQAATADIMTIRIEVKSSGGKSSLTLAKAYDRQLTADKQHFRNYERVQLSPSTSGRYEGAVHEFTFDHPQYGERHVAVFRTVFQGKSYELSLNGPAVQFEGNRPIFDAVVASLSLPE